MDAGRIRMSNEDVMNKWFAFLDEVLKKYGIKDMPDRIYNCDETGWTGRESARAKVSGQKNGHILRQKTAVSSHVTAHLCVCADGKFLLSMIIFQKKSQDMDSVDAERRIILLGKTGNGKSATGNSLFGGIRVFPPAFSLNAGTTKCQVGRGYYGTRNLRCKIVDTPGLMDMNVKLADLLLEIHRSVALCPGPHAFLLIFSSVNRMTKDEKFTVDLLRIAFGEKVFDHCIIVFTRGGEFSSDEEFEKFWKKSEMIEKLVKKCGGRITRIENKSSVDADDNDVSRLIEMIEARCRNGKENYQYRYLEKHKQVILEHLKKHDGTGTVQEEISSLVIELGKVLSAETWKVMLVGGTLTAVTAAGVGAAGYGVYAVGGAALEMGASTFAGSAIVNNAATIGSAIASTAWTFATKLRFW